MKNKTILTKAFKKAAENGYKVNMPNDPMRGEMPMDDFIKYGVHYKFLFNHKFAEAFFPKPVFDGKRMVISEPFYFKYLREMVCEEDPIKYLEKYL